MPKDTAFEKPAEAVLVYVNHDEPGIRRVEAKSGFRYQDAAGRPVRDPDTMARIATLAIPPAWTDVWICPLARGHIQATGRDAKGRKQYRYHDAWRRDRDGLKFERMIAFGRGLPRLRARVERDLARRGLPREKVIAAVVRLMELTLIRVGNETYVKENKSFGLTTLRDRHAKLSGVGGVFEFRGKSGKVHKTGFRDRRLARIVKACQDVPGQRLFQYLDDDGNQRVGCTSTDAGRVRRLDGVASTVALAQAAFAHALPMEQMAELRLGALEAAPLARLLESLRVLTPLMHDDPSRCLVTGTGLTHLGSAATRDAMHHKVNAQDESALTDSMRMFKWGLEGGRPAAGAAGVQPEWFYKGDGSIVVAPVGRAASCVAQSCAALKARERIAASASSMQEKPSRTSSVLCPSAETAASYVWIACFVSAKVPFASRASASAMRAALRRRIFTHSGSRDS